jgi:hypothetical protein
MPSANPMPPLGPMSTGPGTDTPAGWPSFATGPSSGHPSFDSVPPAPDPSSWFRSTHTHSVDTPQPDPLAHRPSLPDLPPPARSFPNSPPLPSTPPPPFPDPTAPFGSPFPDPTAPTPFGSDLAGPGASYPTPATPHPTGEEYLPIFASVEESSWFSKPAPTADHREPGWTSPADEGWQAADAVAEPAGNGVTSSGLPKRTPRANLVPGTANPQPPPAPAPAVSPDRLRSRLAGYQQGVRKGRAELEEDS